MVGAAALVVIMGIVTSVVLHSAMKVEWKVNRIEGTDNEAYWPYVATDDTGTLHMTYWSTSEPYVNGSLIHSALRDEGWEHSVVDEALIYSVSPIMFDSIGIPHICYQVYQPLNESPASYPNNYILMHAEKVGGEWVSSIVNNTTNKGSHSMALDASGNAHVAFIRSGDSGNSTDFVYSSNMNGSWQETLLSSTSSSGSGMTSIAIDASGHPHVAIGWDHGFVGVFSDIGGDWNLTTLFNWDGTSNSVSIDISDDDAVHVCYWGAPAGDPFEDGVMLAIRDSDGWTIERVYTRDRPAVARFSIDAADGGRVRIALEMIDDNAGWLAFITSCEGGWEYSVAMGPYSDYLTSYHWQLSVCSDEDGHTIVAVSRACGDYATDSIDLSDRLASVSLFALASYSVGFVVWIAGMKIGRSIRNRGKGEFGRQ